MSESIEEEFEKAALAYKRSKGISEMQVRKAYYLAGRADERKRCAEIARADRDFAGIVGKGIANAIERQEGR